MRRLIFRGYEAGLSNQRLSLEIGVGLALLTNRVLVPYGFGLPCAAEPRIWPPGGGHPPATVVDLFDLPVQVDPRHVLCDEVDLHSSVRCRWPNVRDSVLCFPNQPDDDDVMFRDFLGQRQNVLSLDDEQRRAPDLVIDAETLGVYCRFFYLPRARQRSLNDQMRQVRPRPPYSRFATRLASHLSDFNAVHIRRSDFVTAGFTPRSSDVSGDEIAATLRSRMDTDKKLVICTDGESSDPFFQPILDAFREVVFLDDLLLADGEWSEQLRSLPHHDEAVVALTSQMVAARADVFVGTLFSSFTAIIHRSRGFRGIEPNFLYTHADWLGGDVRFHDGRYLPNADGHYSWNQVRFPIDVHALSWFREWPESYSAEAPARLDSSRPGSVVLPASRACIHGRNLRYEHDEAKRCIGFWTHRPDYVSWALTTVPPGSYEVQIRYACPKRHAGAIYSVGIEGGPRLIGEVVTTSSWLRFSPWSSVGCLTVPDTSDRTLSVRATSMPRGAVMNLRALRLVPVTTAE